MAARSNRAAFRAIAPDPRMLERLHATDVGIFRHRFSRSRGRGGGAAAAPPPTRPVSRVLFFTRQPSGCGGSVTSARMPRRPPPRHELM